MFRAAPPLACAVLAVATGFGFSPLGHAASPEPAPVAAAWKALADSRAKDAFFQLHGQEPGSDRERELARATAMLDAQPVTNERLREAGRIFQQVAEGDDELAQIATYLQGRLYQAHLTPHDYKRAAEFYRTTAERWPTSHWGQLSIVKLAMFQLYVTREPAEISARLKTVAQALDRLSEPGLRRDLHLQIGQAGTFFGAPLPEVLPHLEAADAIGGLGVLTQKDLVAQLGELSFRAGRWADARKYFQRYLAAYSDVRKFTVEQRLRETEARLAGHQEDAR